MIEAAYPTDSASGEDLSYLECCLRKRDASGEDLSYLECCLKKKIGFWRRYVLPGVLPEEEEMLLEKICAGTNGQEEPAQHHQHTPGQVEGLGGR